MTREYLGTLTCEELIDLILQLQATVIEVKAKMAELEVQLASKRRPPKTSTNSSVPPSSDRKGNRQNTKKRSEAQSMVMQARVLLEYNVC